MLEVRPTGEQGNTVPPPGFNTVTPYFFVADVESFVRFLVQGLGGTETCRIMRPNGLIQNVQVKLARQQRWLRLVGQCRPFLKWRPDRGG